MNKTLLSGAALLTALLSPALLAQTSLSSAIEQCRAEQNALKRLVCYDEITTANSHAIPVRPEQSAQPKNHQAAQTSQQTAESDFGREHRRKIDESADKIYAVVSSIRYSPRKELIIAFDNGQVWRQNGSGNYAINVGERHFIRRGVLGAFYLGNDNNNRTLKVKRED